MKMSVSGVVFGQCLVLPLVSVWCCVWSVSGVVFGQCLVLCLVSVWCCLWSMLYFMWYFVGLCGFDVFGILYLSQVLVYVRAFTF